MEIRVPRAVFDRIREHARETYPEECCGFLIGGHEGTDRSVTEARPAENVSPDSRRTQYTIDNELTRRTEAEFRVGPLRIVGFYHSHIDAPPVPSEIDRRRAWPYYVYAILALRAREPAGFEAWLLNEGDRTFARIPTVIE